MTTFFTSGPHWKTPRTFSVEALISWASECPQMKGPGHSRGIAGTLAVLLRSIPAAEHAAIAAIRADKGIKAAINAARAAVKKG
jgi:hypothetical protein